MLYQLIRSFPFSTYETHINTFMNSTITKFEKKKRKIRTKLIYSKKVYACLYI